MDKNSVYLRANLILSPCISNRLPFGRRFIFLFDQLVDPDFFDGNIGKINVRLLNGNAKT